MANDLGSCKDRFRTQLVEWLLDSNFALKTVDQLCYFLTSYLGHFGSVNANDCVYSVSMIHYNDYCFTYVRCTLKQ